MAHPPSNDRLGELLIREKAITPAQLSQARADHARHGGRLITYLTRVAGNEDALLSALATSQGVPRLKLTDYEIDEATLKLFAAEFAKKHSCIPVHRAGTQLVVAVTDASDLNLLGDIKFMTSLNVEFVLASEREITDAITRYYDKATDVGALIDTIDVELESADKDDDLNRLELTQATEAAPVVMLCNGLLTHAIKIGASDIHIEPYEKRFRVRYRVDGVLTDYQEIKLGLRAVVTSRLKIMAGLDIAERRLPQDGRIKLKIGKAEGKGGQVREMEFRVSVLPTLYGEKVVLRLLDKSNLQLDMRKLGFDQTDLELFQREIHKPYGMVLVTGPTGSGKTTTLYSALSELNKVTENISTAEDPVEYTLEGVNQVQTNDTIGLNFAGALRAFLRQDPDIIMVGEIRDFETAEIAVKAALTGHLVLSTLHTNDAPSTVNRLLNMGVEPFLVTASVNLILAQRLVRKICRECAQPIPVEPGVLHALGMTPDQVKTAKLFKGAGCRTCGNTGYKGRISLYEVMHFSPELKELVLQGASVAELKAAAIRNRMRTLRMAGIAKVLEGITTIEEVSRVTAAD